MNELLNKRIERALEKTGITPDEFAEMSAAARIIETALTEQQRNRVMQLMKLHDTGYHRALKLFARENSASDEEAEQLLRLLGGK